MNNKVATATLLLRLSLGALFLAHGLMKLFIFTPAGTVGYFASLGIPPIFAWLTMAAEAGGGVLLLLGVQVRWVALLQLPVILGALVVHSSNGWVFSSPNGGWEFPALCRITSYNVCYTKLLRDAYRLSAYRPCKASPSKKPADRGEAHWHRAHHA